MRGTDDKTVTYAFDEVVEKICQLKTREDIELLAKVVSEERRSYCLYHLRILAALFNLKRSVL